MGVASNCQSCRIARVGFALCLLAACREPRDRASAGRDGPVGAAASRPAARGLGGIVQDKLGRPLPDARVFAWPSGQRSTDAAAAEVIETRADSDGRFFLAAATHGRWRLLAEAPGFGTLELSAVLAPSGKLRLRLQGEARTLGGMVVGPDGNAVARCRVVLTGSTLPTTREALCSDNGTFMFHGLGEGRFALRANHESRASTPVVQSIDESLAFIPPVQLRLVPGGRLFGRVASLQGDPLAGVEVIAVALPADDAPATAMTGSDGTFEFPALPPGRVQLFARYAGHALLRAPEAMIKVGAFAQVDLALARTASLRGRVLDPQHHPVAGAAIGVVGLVRGSDELTVIPGRLPTAALAAGTASAVLGREGRARSATSGSDGRFVVADVPPGKLKIEVTSPAGGPLRIHSVALRPGLDKDMGDLALPRNNSARR